MLRTIETPPGRTHRAAVVPLAGRYVRLLDLDADLGEGIPAADWPLARRTVLVARVDVAGEWAPTSLQSRRRPFAAMVTDGLMVRELQLGTRVTSQLIGPGDVLNVGPAELAGIVCHASAPT